jgi:hypothetical protein
MKNDNDMYGCSIEIFAESAANSFTYKVSGGGMIVASLLSDAQELIAFGDTEGARKELNKAKALLFKMMDNELSFHPTTS